MVVIHQKWSQRLSSKKSQRDFVLLYFLVIVYYIISAASCPLSRLVIFTSYANHSCEPVYVVCAHSVTSTVSWTVICFYVLFVCSIDLLSSVIDLQRSVKTESPNCKSSEHAQRVWTVNLWNSDSFGAVIEIELIYFELYVVFSVIFDLIFLAITRSAWLIELNFKTIFHYIGNLNNSVRFRVDSVLNFFVYLSSIYHVLFSHM